MPICIECRYPVPQLYHVLHSNKQHKSVTAAHSHSSLSSSSKPAAHASAATTPSISPPTPPFPPAAAVISPSSFSTLAARGGGGEDEAAKIAAKVKTPQGAGAGAGGDVRLTQCPRCKRFADKYVEHDFVVLFIDLVLVKPQVGFCSVSFFYLVFFFFFGWYISASLFASGFFFCLFFSWKDNDNFCLLQKGGFDWEEEQLGATFLMPECIRKPAVAAPK